jgi:hypothetical protein
MSKKDFPQPKQINLSNSFVARSRCKFCGKEPTKSFLLKIKTTPTDINSFKRLSSWIQSITRRLCAQYISPLASPKHYKKISYLSYDPLSYAGLSYETTKLICRDMPAYNFMDCVCCECGKTMWLFYDSCGKQRPEIANRKAKKSYPQKFQY